MEIEIKKDTVRDGITGKPILRYSIYRGLEDIFCIRRTEEGELALHSSFEHLTIKELEVVLAFLKKLKPK